MRISENIARHLGHYVYRLVDPRNGETFYVGKGTGNRVMQHERNVVSREQYDTLSSKEDRVQAILNGGEEPILVIHRHGLDENTAFEVEGALIDAYPGLSNDQDGHNNTTRGAMSLKQLIQAYELPIFPALDVPAALINVNKITNKSTPAAIYRQVRGHWKVDADRIGKAKLIVAVERGVAIGIFRPKRWFPSDLIDGRKCFEGTIAHDLWDTYIGQHGKRIERPEYQHSQFPIRYVNL